MMEARLGRRLQAADWATFAEAALLLSLVRIGLRLLPFRTARQLLDRYARRARSADGTPASGHVARVTRAVRAVSRRLPGTTTCLVDALVADAMLRRRGCASELRFGVRPPGSGAGPLDGHAWIEHRGTVVLGNMDNLSDYVPSRSRTGAD
jgi:transglutaminase superfamily protein